jgi:ABC-type transport system substrate-binding protein
MVFRRRLVFWLLREYIRKWGKTFALFFLIGLAVFFGLWMLLTYYKPTVPKFKKESIGVVGAYTPDTLPPYILLDIARGLTKIAPDGKVQPDLASTWDIKQNGKEYIFHLRKNLHFSNGKNFTTDVINYNFSDATVKKLDKYTLDFTLKDQYTPFLATLSRPVFINGFVGVGNYKLQNIKLNGTFVQSITLVSLQDAYDTKTYLFYPTADSLKIAFMLGEITQARGLFDDNFRGKPFTKFPNISVNQSQNTTQLVTLFYNTKDSYLSDRDARVGLTYALPDTFPNGKRSYTIYPSTSWAYSPQYTFTQDIENAKQLTSNLHSASKSGSLILSLKTLAKYEDTAEIIKKNWEKIGVESIVEVVDTVPDNFQVFLGDYTLPKDPDQYMLWHAGQPTNITNYQSSRIDKLLEDGRKTLKFDDRKKIYDDLQKYLLADAPAAFLYFPIEYTITRK